MNSFENIKVDNLRQTETKFALNIMHVLVASTFHCEYEFGIPSS